MPPELLRRKCTIPELEAEFLVNGIPFGSCSREWAALIEIMLPTDELWFWSSSSEDWDRLMGSEGIALVRDQEIVDFFITSLN